jgi:hypothetical protein
MTRFASLRASRMSAWKSDNTRTPFITLEDHQLYEKYNGKSFGVQVISDTVENRIMW